MTYSAWAHKKISFFTEDVPFVLKHKAHIRNWLLYTIEKEQGTIAELNFIFCSDEYLLKINAEHLDHHYYTDIITFDNRDVFGEGPIVGDIFISIDRVAENALSYNVSAIQELRRVLVHGTLHLLGYKDKTKAQAATMREKEDFYLQKFSEIQP